MTANDYYKQMMDDLFAFDSNPTYELAGVTIEYRYGSEAVKAMEAAGLIRYAGQNWNGLAVYQVR